MGHLTLAPECVCVVGSIGINNVERKRHCGNELLLYGCMHTATKRFLPSILSVILSVISYINLLREINLKGNVMISFDK